MRNKNSNLRFLLALGSKKVVVMQEENNLHIYSDGRISRQGGLSLQRIGEAVTAK